MRKTFYYNETINMGFCIMASQPNLTNEVEKKEIKKPQPGPQSAFLSSPADIAIFGGSAGGGKTAALLMEAVRYTENPNFGAVIFRRTSPEITNPGGLWDESQIFYGDITGAKPTMGKTLWEFKSGAKVVFKHMQHEKDKFAWQGSQICLICFDELVHFTATQFFYMLSRNRSTCGIRPYIRATCNPDSKSWVKDFIGWWIDPNTGFPIPERSGVLRWMIRHGDSIIWGDSPKEIFDYVREHKLDVGKDGAKINIQPKSVTFIAATLYDNKILMEKDPSYLASLMALPYVERERLLGGNWNISMDKGIIKKEWIRYYKKDALPHVIRWTWSLDTAVKEEQANDYSCLQLWAECENGFYLVKLVLEKMEYPKLKSKTLSLFAAHPAHEVLIEDKASGQQLIQDFRPTKLPVIAMMPGRNMGKTKVERVNLTSTMWEAGKVFIPEDEPWAAQFITNMLNFPEVEHDDDVDACSQFLSRAIQMGRFLVDDIGAPSVPSGKIVGTGMPTEAFEDDINEYGDLVNNGYGLALP